MLSNEKLWKILFEGDQDINILGHLYHVVFWPELDIIALQPIGDDSEARSNYDRDSYGYTDGGHIFKKAVDIAIEIKKELVAWRSLSSDV